MIHFELVSITLFNITVQYLQRIFDIVYTSDWTLPTCQVRSELMNVIYQRTVWYSRILSVQRTRNDFHIPRTKTPETSNSPALCHDKSNGSCSFEKPEQWMKQTSNSPGNESEACPQESLPPLDKLAPTSQQTVQTRQKQAPPKALGKALHRPRRRHETRLVSGI